MEGDSEQLGRAIVVPTLAHYAQHSIWSSAHAETHVPPILPLAKKAHHKPTR